MNLNGPRQLSLRLKVSLAVAIASSAIILLGCMVVMLFVMTKRNADMDRHLKNLAHQIVTIPQIQAVLEEQVNAPKPDIVIPILESLIYDDPFIQEITIIDQFDKVLFRIEPPILMRRIPETGIVASNQETSATQPTHIEDSRESMIELSTGPISSLGRLRVRWKPEATWKFSRVLKITIGYVTAASFLITFLVSFFLLLRGYSREYAHMARTLSLIVGGDYTQRIDTSAYSSGINDLGVYINRFLSEMEEERKKALILDHTLRQVEKNCNDYRKSLNERSHELDSLRRDLRQGLYTLFDLIWNGLIIIDDEFFVHFMNEQAERLLRFARFDESTITDDRLRKCLTPLVRSKSCERIDDLCVWTQRTLGHSVSCRLRAAQIPTGDGTRLFFVLLKEESGFPKYHGSSYYSERLVFDVLATDRQDSLVLSNQAFARGAWEPRFRECLRKIETFRDLEEGRVGPISTLRLPFWLCEHFKADDLFSSYLNIDAQIHDMDIALHVPERLLAEIIDSLIYIISQVTAAEHGKRCTEISVRSSVDSRGKPVITFSLPRIAKNRVAQIQEILDERVNHISDFPQEGPFTLDDLEQDITLSIYRLIRRLLKIQVECVFSENKQLATIRMTIENHALPIPELAPVEAELSSHTATDPIRKLVREFLNGY